MTTALPALELNGAAIHAALAALHAGRSTGSAPLDQVVVALGRCRARAWARFRGAWPDVTDAEVDAAADRAVQELALVPGFVALLVMADAAPRAALEGDA